MMTAGERSQWLATIELVLHLVERGVACGVYFPRDQVPVIRVDALSAFETSAHADGHYDVWDAGEPPLAPLAAYLSLAEAVAFLCAHEGRA